MYEEWVEDIRWQNPHYTNEEILFAALAIHRLKPWPSCSG
jgi:hypothetical protein